MLERLRNFLSHNSAANGVAYITPNRLLEFSIGDRNFLAEYDREGDPDYFRILLPIVEHIESELPEGTAQRMARISSAYKVGKAIQVGNNIWLSAEVFVYDRLNTDALFARLIDVLNAMFVEYNNMRNGEEGQN